MSVILVCKSLKFSIENKFIIQKGAYTIVDTYFYIF